MKRPRSRRVPRGARGAAVFAVLPFLIFASCVTAPKSPEPLGLGAEYLPLEPGAALYMIMDVGKARPVLDGVNFLEMGEGRAKQVLDMTKTAVTAVYPPGPKRFQAVAWGKYPAFRAGLSFAFSSEWKKAKSVSGASYWRSGKAGLSLSFSASQAYVSDGDPFALSPGTALPEDFGAFSRGSVLACWFPEPRVPIDRLIAALGLPLQIPAEEVLIGLYAAGEKKYEALIRIEMPSSSQARAVAALLNMTRNFLSGLENPAQAPDADGGAPLDPAALAALLFANLPVQDGVFLSIKTAPLSETTASLLLQILSVYSY
ncbi:MAG: hypothetical protein LBD71_01835 [Treponema sp.]|nr:hypothetical protein [Treponema sp.]